MTRGTYSVRLGLCTQLPSSPPAHAPCVSSLPPALEKACLGGHQGAAELLLRELQGRHPQDWCDLDDIMGLPCLAASKG